MRGSWESLRSSALLCKYLVSSPPLPYLLFLLFPSLLLPSLDPALFLPQPLKPLSSLSFTQPFKPLPTLSFPQPLKPLPYPTLPYPTLPYPTLSHPTLPYPSKPTDPTDPNYPNPTLSTLPQNGHVLIYPPKWSGVGGLGLSLGLHGYLALEKYPHPRTLQ